MSTNAPFTNAEGSQQLILTEKRKALLKTMLPCTEISHLPSYLRFSTELSKTQN